MQAKIKELEVEGKEPTWSLVDGDTVDVAPLQRRSEDRISPYSEGFSIEPNTRCAAMLVNLGELKLVSRMLGPDVGDLILQQVIKRLSMCVRQGDALARLSEDELVVIVRNLGSNWTRASARATEIAVQITEALNDFAEEEHQYTGAVSIGIAMFTGQENNEIVRQAGIAMLHAKTSGGKAVLHYQDAMLRAAVAKIGMVADIRKALFKREFVVFYQPQVNFEGRPTGAEALLRWQHPTKGMVAPSEFIPSAEESGMMVQLGRWVMEAACEQLRNWADDVATKDLTISVNVSVVQFQSGNFVFDVRELLMRTGANPRRLKLEVTESLLLADVSGTVSKMQELKQLGIQFSLDDFGTGYSSLKYLRLLPLNQLKIDISFVMNIVSSPADAAIVRMIIALTHEFNIDVIAEGVETIEQRNFLRQIGCSDFQGYLFSRPMNIDFFNSWLAGSVGQGGK